MLGERPDRETLANEATRLVMGCLYHAPQPMTVRQVVDATELPVSTVGGKFTNLSPAFTKKWIRQKPNTRPAEYELTDKGFKVCDEHKMPETDEFRRFAPNPRRQLDAAEFTHGRSPFHNPKTCLILRYLALNPQAHTVQEIADATGLDTNTVFNRFPYQTDSLTPYVTKTSEDRVRYQINEEGADVYRQCRDDIERTIARIKVPPAVIKAIQVLEGHYGQKIFTADGYALSAETPFEQGAWADYARDLSRRPATVGK